MEKYGIGQPVRRVEDSRFLRGKGCFLDDTTLASQAHGVVLRSPHAHARIERIDATAALALPGVLAVFTGADWITAGCGDMPTRTAVKNPDGTPIFTPPRPALVADRVRYVGDAVVFVVAETAQVARDAVELIKVDYDPLPAITGAKQALAPDAPLVWEDAPGNLCVAFEAGDREQTDRVFAQADHVVSLRLNNQRVTAAPLEPRGAIGEYHTGSDCFTLTASTQNVHATRKELAEQVLHIQPDKLRVVAPDVGGGFGVKTALYPEYALVLFAARWLERPVKWVNDRSESFISDTHGRDQYSEAALALDPNGRFLALRVDSIGDTGAYVSTIGPFVATAGSARTQGGPYRIPAIHFRSRVAYTHTVPTDPYRGAGRPEATYVIERLVDAAAQTLAIDPVELRQRNLIRPEQLPYRTAMGAEVDSGNFPALLERALVLADRPGFAARAANSQARGKLRGFGVCTYLECTGGAPAEFAGIRFEPDGSAVVAVGCQSTGTGHETVFPQLVTDRLGLPFESIRLIQADTDATPIGGGHGGSRSLETGGAAVLAASDKIIEKARHIAGHALEAALEDLVFDDGRFTIAGTDRSLSLVDVAAIAFDPARRPPGMEPGLDESARFDRAKVSYPNGCHIAEVEIDPETGVVKILNYVIVDDFGTILNPLLTDGQVMGGTAQGIGQALYEQIVYDRAGQLLSGSFMDYCLPRADGLPAFAIEYFEDAPTNNNPLGVKGAGEAGCVGALPAVVNAAVSALRDYGVRHVDMPLTPAKIWRLIRDRGNPPDRENKPD